MTSPKTHAAVAAGLLVIISSRPIDAASPVQTQWVVTTAKATGARGEEFVSSLRLLNLNSLEASVALTFLPQSPLDASLRANGDNSNASSVSVVVPAGKKLDIGDVFSFLGGNSGAGAIRVASSGRDPQGQPLSVAALSLTTTVVGSPAQVLFGPSIPAQGPDALVGVGEPAWVPFLWTGGAPEGSWYRSNVFLLSTNVDSQTVVTVTLVDYAHNVRGSKDVTLARLAQTQINDVGSFFGYQPCFYGCPSGTPQPEEILLSLSVRSGGPVAAGGSIIDNLTGASLYVPVVKASALQAP